MKKLNNQEENFKTTLFLPSNERRIGEGGLRTKGSHKKSHEGSPLISIITVVFNGERYLEDTIVSVLSQTYDNIEYLIIDGGSDDGTLDIIRKYEGEIDYWVSEKDDGVYDAMNKGIDLVMGDWVNFINSSDTIEKNGYKLVLDDLLNCSDKLNAIAFGYSYSIADLQGNLVNKVVTPNLDKKWKMPSSHNSIVYKSNVLKKHKFDLSFKCASDFDQLNKINNSNNIGKNNYVLSKGRADGFIAQNKFQSFLEYFQICWQSDRKVYAVYWAARLILVYLNLRFRKFL